MSTNYYAVNRKTNQSVHIGLSARGWLFLFQKSEIFTNYESVKNWLKQHTETGEYIIRDEYNNLITYDEFIKFIDSNYSNELNKSNPDNFRYCENINGYRFNLCEKFF